MSTLKLLPLLLSLVACGPQKDAAPSPEPAAQPSTQQVAPEVPELPTVPELVDIPQEGEPTGPVGYPEGNETPWWPEGEVAAPEGMELMDSTAHARAGCTRMACLQEACCNRCNFGGWALPDGRVQVLGELPQCVVDGCGRCEFDLELRGYATDAGFQVLQSRKVAPKARPESGTPAPE